MKRKPRRWTKRELALLGTKPDAEVAELTGRTFGTVWQKRRALGIAQPALRFRKWTPAEDKLVGTAPDAEIALRLGRTESAIKSRRAILEREQAKHETKIRISDPIPCPAVLRTLGAHPVAVHATLHSQTTTGTSLLTAHTIHRAPIVAGSWSVNSAAPSKSAASATRRSPGQEFGADAPLSFVETCCAP